MQTLRSLKYHPYLAISIVWILITIIVNPIGNFPVNDDWAYAENVQELVVNGKIYFSDWPAMTLITQTMIGSVASLFFGYSFTVLRITTVIISLLTLFILYRILKEQGVNKKASLFGVVLLASNPIYFSLSFSFMTEVYYLFFLLISLFAYSQYSKSGKTGKYIVMIIFFVLTVYVRQTALLLAIAFFLVSILSEKFSARNLLRSILPLIVGYAAIFIYKKFRVYTGNSLGTFSDISMLFRSIAESDWNTYVVRSGMIFLYLGLFLTPIAVLLTPKLKFKCKGIRMLGFIPVAIVIGFCIHGAWSAFPSGNILYDTGLGARLLKDNIFQFNVINKAPDFVWLSIKLIAVFSMTVCSISLYLMFIRFFGGSNWKGLKKRIRKNKERYFLIVFVAGELAYLLINPIFFDRYTLTLFTTVGILILVSEIKQIQKPVVGYIIAIVLLVFSVLTTHDYLRWQEARHVAFMELQRQAVPLNQIDAGFELNALAKVAPISEVYYDPTKKSWWWVDEDEYLLTSGDYIGYRKVLSIPVRSWLMNESIHVLKRIHSADRGRSMRIICDFEKLSIDKRLVINSQNEAFMEARISDHALSGNNSLIVDPEQPYAINYSIDSLRMNEKIEITIRHQGAPSYLIVDSKVKGGPVLRTSSKKIIDNSLGWGELTLSLMVDSTWVGQNALVYVWNPNADPAYFDDLEIRISNSRH